MNGGPVMTAGWDAAVPAVMEAWFAGQEQGDAIARVLFGDVNPSGQAAPDLPRRRGPHSRGHTGAVPRRRRHGSTTARASSSATEATTNSGSSRDIPFGHGHSYTEFVYADLDGAAAAGRAPMATELAAVDAVLVSFDHENLGPRPGTEVAQVYVGRLPDRCGESATASRRLGACPSRARRNGVTFTVSIARSSVSYWDVDAHRLARSARAGHNRSRAVHRSDIRLEGSITIV